MKPSLDLRRRLVIAGINSHDPLDVMNAFNMNEGGSSSIGDEYWQTMVAVLCERVCRAEKWLDELRAELAVMHSNRLTECEQCIWERSGDLDDDWAEAVCRVCGKTDSVDVMTLRDE